MIRAYCSEWLKLRRPAMILGGAGSMVGFAVLAIVLTLSRLGSTAGGPGITPLSGEQIAASTGFAQLMGNSATFMGVIALAVFAISVAGEYSNGTLRNLLVRQPGRLRLLAGKVLAVAGFVALAVLLSFAAALISAILLVPGHGVSTAAWFTGQGVGSLLSTAGNLLLSTLAWGVIGTVLALILRSTATAVVVGLAYALPVENLLTAAWPGAKHWLPGQLIEAVAQGGTSAVSYSTAVLLVGLYLLLAGGVTNALFRHRDVVA